MSLLFKSDGEHQGHRFWPAAGVEQLGYWPAATDATSPDAGAVLSALDADDGHPKQHCSGSAECPCSASTTSAP